MCDAPCVFSVMIGYIWAWAGNGGSLRNMGLARSYFCVSGLLWFFFIWKPPLSKFDFFDLFYPFFISSFFFFITSPFSIILTFFLASCLLLFLSFFFFPYLLTKNDGWEA